MKSLSVLMLRYKQPGHRDWKVPLNFYIGKTEIPLGLVMITVTLFALAVINVLTKKTATIAGTLFTIAFFVVFELSDIYNRKRKAAHGPETEKFRLDTHSEVTKEAVHVRPGNVMVAVRNPNRLQHLERILLKTDTRKIDIVVLSVRILKAGSGEYVLEPDQMFADDETQVFSKVVNLAEKAGKHVELMVVLGTNPYDAIVQTAARLQSSRIVMGLSPKLTPNRVRRSASIGRNSPNRVPPSLSNSCSKMRRTWCSSTWAPIRRASGPRTSTWSIAFGSNSAPRAPDRNCITAMCSVSPCAAWPPN
jgi:nucleotide-binding universal stress UspA family protein